MVEIDKILSECSDARILEGVKALPEQSFGALVEKVMGYLELKFLRSRTRESFVIADCEHRPDGRGYVVYFSRRDEPVVREDVENLISYMEKVSASDALVFTVAEVDPEARKLLDEQTIGFADGAKLAALLRRFDLDKEVRRVVDSVRASVPAEPERTLVRGGRLEDAMKAGYDALAGKDHMRALEAFDLAISLDDTYDVPWRLKGNTLDEMGYHEQALECYKRALELSAESDETWFSLGNCFYSLGRYTEEVMCYDKALFYNPAMQKALINKGSTLHRLGRYDEALETYDTVLRINYRLEKVHNNRGATLHAMGRGPEALDSYDRATELKHDYVEAWMNKGNLLYEMARYEDALEAFSQVTRFRPESPKGWHLKGMVSRRLGRTTQAKTAFEQALRLDPDYVEARRALEEESRKIAEKFVEVPRIVEHLFQRPPAQAEPVPPEAPAGPVMPEDMVARVHEQKVEELAEELYGDRAALLLLLGRPDEAFEFLGKSLRLEGENASLLTAAGNVLYKQGKAEAAVRSYEHAVSVDPTYVPALMALQTALMDAGDRERAHAAGEKLRASESGWQGHALAALEARQRMEFDKTLEDVENALTSDNLAALVNLKGLLKLAAGDLDGAAEAFEHSKSMPLDQSEAHNNAGAVLLKKGEIERSSFELDKAIRLMKANPAAWSNRGCVLYRFDRLREAVACFEESMLISPTTVAMNNKGFSHLTLDNLPDALSSFEQSLKLSETAEGHNDRGIVLLRMGRIEEARVAFKEALRLAPKFKDALSNLKRAESLKPMPAQGESEDSHERPPGVEVVGGEGMPAASLEELTPENLRKMRKTELEAVCESLGVSPTGTKAELVSRAARARRRLQKK